MRQLLGRMYFRFLTNDNWRWLALASFTAAALVATLALLPYVFTPAETVGVKAERELYGYAAHSWGEPALAPYGFREWISGALRWVALATAGVLVFSAFATAIYFFPAFGDDARRATGAVRVRFWDRYGAEIKSSGFFTRWLLGNNPPPGSNPPTAPAAGGQPLTKPAFLFWEAAIDFANEFLGHRLWGKR